MKHGLRFVLVILPVLGCGAADAGGHWAGTIDTLPNGAVRVQNPAEGVWTTESAWEVVADLRLGAVDAEGPEQFGKIDPSRIPSSKSAYQVFFRDRVGNL